jgi:hypothetical protein
VILQDEHVNPHKWLFAVQINQLSLHGQVISPTAKVINECSHVSNKQVYNGLKILNLQGIQNQAVSIFWLLLIRTLVLLNNLHFITAVVLFIFIDGLETEVLKIHFLAENRPAEVNLCEQLLNKRCN